MNELNERRRANREAIQRASKPTFQLDVRLAFYRHFDPNLVTNGCKGH